MKPSRACSHSNRRRTPIGKLHLDSDASAEVVDDGFKRDGKRAGRCVEILFPIAAAEGYGANGDAVLLKA